MMRKTLLACLFCLVATAFLASDLDAQVPRGSIQIDQGNPGTAYDPVVYADKGRVYMAWSDTRTGGNGVYFSYSTDDGVTFSAPVQLDSDVAGARKDLIGNGIIANGAHVYVWWYDRRDAGTGTNDNIWFAASHDGGANFSADQRIDDTGTPGQYDVAAATMGASGMNVYFGLMVNDVGGTSNEGAYVTYSNDGGVIFAAAQFVGNGNPGDFDVDTVGLGAYGDNAFVAYNDLLNGNDDVFGVPFDKNGVVGSIVRIDSDGAGAGDVEPYIYVAMTSATDVHVCWLEERASTTNEEVRYNNSTDGGVTFLTDQLIGGYTAGTDDVDSQWLDATGSSVIIGWEDNRTGADEIYAAVSTDGGVIFGADVAASSGGGGYPRVAIDGDIAAVAWTGPAFPEEAWVAWSRDGGATFGAPVNMSVTVGDVDYAELSIDTTYNTCHVAYLDDTLGVNNLFVNSFRSATLSLVGTPTQGSPINFSLAGAVASESTPTDVLRVATSWSLGSIVLSDGRVVGLTIDTLFLNSLNFAPALSGAMNPDGSANTPTINLPIPSGLTFYAVGAVKLGGGGFGSITDPIAITVN
jgi:hypothetical protein